MTDARLIPGYDVLSRLMDLCLAADLAPEASVLMVGACTDADVLDTGLRHPQWRLTKAEPALETLDAETTFDAAMLTLVLHVLPDDGEKLALLSGIAERLNPGAPLMLSTYFGDPGATRTKKLHDLARAWAVANGMSAEEAAEKLNPARGDMHVVSEERLKSLLREAGYIDVQRIYQGLLIGAWSARAQR